MKAKTPAIITATAIILGATNAHANLLFDLYTGATYGIGGHTIFSDHNHTSTSSNTYGAVLGIDIPLLRFEIEYNRLDTKTLEMNLGMTNAYFKFPTPIAKPYLGAGFGIAFNSKYNNGTNNTHTKIPDKLTYQAMVGLTLDLAILPFDIDIEGRILYAPDIFKTYDTDTNLLQYDGRIKLRYIF